MGREGTAKPKVSRMDGPHRGRGKIQEARGKRQDGRQQASSLEVVLAVKPCGLPVRAGYEGRGFALGDLGD